MNRSKAFKDGGINGNLKLIDENKDITVLYIMGNHTDHYLF